MRMFRAVRGRCLRSSRCGLQLLRQAGTSHMPRVTCSHVAQIGNGRVLALRREDNSVWERRAPLSPSHVQQLVKSGVRVIVQPSNRRAFPMQVGLTIIATRQDVTELFVNHFWVTTRLDVQTFLLSLYYLVLLFHRELHYCISCVLASLSMKRINELGVVRY